MLKGLTSKLAQYPRLRVLLIVALMIIIFVVVLNIMSPGDANKRPNLPPSHVESGSAQGSSPVSKEQAQQYNNLNKQVDQQELKSQVSQGKTVLNNVFNPAAVKETDTFAQQQSDKTKSHMQNIHKIMSPEEFAQSRKKDSANQKLANLNPQKQADHVFNRSAAGVIQGDEQQAPQEQQIMQQQSQALSDLQSQYQNAINSASNDWNLPKMAQTQGVAAPPHKDNTYTAPPPKTVVKAGTIYFGVMETALDSDQPGTPVMAQVVSGPFRGAKLMGSFTRENDRLVIQFNRMSMPQWSNTIGISAYAIDAKTANNALATSVNHHYLLRYGMLFASAFLEGFGNAYQSFTYACPPGTASCNIVDSNGLQNNQVTATTAAYQGLGQIGTNIGQAAQNVFNNTPPTVKVAQGTGIGVLFMSDITLSTE